MDQVFKSSRSGKDIVLDHKRSMELLGNIVQSKAGPETFETVRLDKEAAASFIARQAALMSAVAHASGLSTAKIICDVLYVNTHHATVANGME